MIKEHYELNTCYTKDLTEIEKKEILKKQKLMFVTDLKIKQMNKFSISQIIDIILCKFNTNANNIIHLFVNRKNDLVTVYSKKNINLEGSN